MQLSQSLLSGALLLCSAAAAASSPSWGFSDASVVVAAKKGAAEGERFKFTQSTPPTDPITLPHDGTLKLTLTTTTSPSNTPARPHQAFLTLTDPTTGLSAPFPLTVSPTTGRATVTLSPRDIPAPLLLSASTDQPLAASVVLGSFGSEARALEAQVFELLVRVDPAAPLPKYEEPVRHRKKEEIHHVFQKPARSPPRFISMVFLLAVLAMLPVLFVGWLILGANASHLPKALRTAPLSHVIFFGSLVAMEAVFVKYYASWTLFQMLPVAGCVAFVAVLSGTKALGEVQGRRLAGER